MNRRTFFTVAAGVGLLAGGSIISIAQPSCTHAVGARKNSAMNKIELPGPFDQFEEIGGVLKFASFDEANEDISSALAAICNVVPDMDTELLNSLGYRRIDEPTFLGDWYDLKSGDLVLYGDWTAADGRVLTNPTPEELTRFTELERNKIIQRDNQNGNQLLTVREIPTPNIGSGGQFAYAFLEPPYGLRAPSRTIQDVFDKIRDFIIPPNLDHVILDWSNPRLPEASPYFKDGAEWWGVFLFTIYVPALGRLTAIAGSTTD